MSNNVKCLSIYKVIFYNSIKKLRKKVPQSGGVEDETKGDVYG
jgi:hypothetical protein